MEENSDVHMETDVSSTTDDVVETQEVTGSNGQVEMIITVEKVDEDTSNIEDAAQAKLCSNISTVLATQDSPPTTKPESQTLESPIKINEVSNPTQQSPDKTESPQKVTSIISPGKISTPTSSMDQKAEIADSSTKIDSLTSPIKDISKVTPTLGPIVNIKQAFLIVKNPPNKETGAVQSLVKDGMRNVTSLILKSPPKEKLVERTLLKKPEEPRKTYQVTSHRSPIKSPPIKLVRKQPLKEFKIHDTTVKEINIPSTTNKEIQETKSSNSKDPPIEPKVNGESTIFKPRSPSEERPELQSLPSTDVPIDVEAEASNDSQLSSSASEKEHKSISRELRSLINSAKESKIISECTQLTSKTRKSRTNLDTSLNVSVETEVHDEKRDAQANESDKPSLKRSMRSQNPEFVVKCKQFLNSVTAKVMKDSDEAQSDSETEDKLKQKTERIEITNSTESSPKKKKIENTLVGTNASKLRSDPYCWRCHWQLEAEPNEKQPIHPPMHCTVCVRSYHSKCMTIAERKVCSEKNWACPDCMQILHAENSETRSPAMKKISLGMLCDLLKFGLERMEALNGVEPFLQPVDRTEFPDYDKIVVHPMDLSQMRRNITDGHYGSTEAFIADAQWILHNSILFNASQSKLTAAARALVRTCRSEMAEIETCPECYAGAHSRNLTYFTEVCSTPHMILWAKLKGFPYWPAKAVAVNNGMVDVRFFGQHDKSWVPVRDCYLYSEKDPNTTKHKKQELMQCRQEAEVHIRNICRKYGSFVYAPFKTTFDHTKMTEQLKMMIPSFEGEIKAVPEKKASPVAKDKRSSSKSSKSSFNDGDVSECDDSSTKSSVFSQKGDDDEPAPKEVPKENPNKEADSSISEKDKPMDVDVSLRIKPEIPTRKRRRSTFPESVPVVESPAHKKKKLDEKPEEKVSEEKGPENKVLQENIPEEKSPEVNVPDVKVSEIKVPEVKVSEEKKNEETPEAGPSKELKREIIKNAEAEIEEITKKVDKPNKATPKANAEKNKSASSKDQEILRVTPIKLVALPRANNQTPKIFTTAKVTTKSTPNTPTTPNTPGTPAEEEKCLNTSSSKRSKITKADRFIMTEQKELKGRSSRRNSRNNKSLTSTSKHDKTDKSDKKSDSGSDASTSKERPSKKKDEADRSLLKKDLDPNKSVKDEKVSKKITDDDISLAAIARSNKNFSSGLPTISNVVSLSTSAEKTNTSTTKTTSSASKNSAGKSIEITIEAKSDSSIFTPTSSGNIGNMKEAVSKLQKLRNDTTSEPFVGRLGVKAFARMTSPDINDDVEVKTEPIDLDEIDENRQIEKMDLMTACKLQPVSQTQSLRDVRINKLVITPSVVMKKSSPKVAEARPRAKKTFPQPKRPEGGSELNGKNSMVYIPIQPPMTQPPLKPVKTGATTQHGISMPANVTAGPRPSAPVIATNSIVNTVTTPLRPTSTLTSPQHIIVASTVANNSVPLSQVSTISQVPTVGPTTVHTVPLMTSVNGQWMFSLQPVMSVGGADSTTSPPMVNGITERPGTTLVPISSTASTSNTAVLPLTPVANRNQLSQNTQGSPANDSNGTPLEMPRLLQRPLMSPFDANTPIGNLPPPSTAGPLTAKLNQNAVKLTDFFRTLLEDSIEKLDEPLAQVTALKIQLEQARWRHQQSLDELKHNNELTLSEMRQSFEKEKLRIVSETRRAAQVELEAAVKLTKSKQWCSNCHQEAQFYCCWNTSYCDYNCQRAHWNTHFSLCTQEKSFRQILQYSQKDHQDRGVQADCNDSRSVITSHLMGQDGPSTLPSVLKDIQNSAESSHDQQPLPLPQTLPHSRKSEQRTLEQQTTNKTIIELGDQRPREQPPMSYKSINYLGDQRVWEQQPVLNKTTIELGEIQRPREQPTLLPPTPKSTLENAPWLQQREDSTTAPLDKRMLEYSQKVYLEDLARRSKKDASESRLQQGDNPPKSVPAQTPCLTTIGGKPAPMRVFTDPSGTQKTSIIVSMIEDPSGNQTLKCLGTYKAPAQAATQNPPLLINKQTNDDSAAKKTVTSGGYLIVGASGTTSVITPASGRRQQIQYFS